MQEYIGEYRDKIRQKSKEWIKKKRALDKASKCKCSECGLPMKRVGVTATFQCRCGNLEVVDAIVDDVDNYIFGKNNKWLEQNPTKKYKNENPIIL